MLWTLTLDTQIKAHDYQYPVKHSLKYNPIFKSSRGIKCHQVSVKLILQRTIEYWLSCALDTRGRCQPAITLTTLTHNNAAVAVQYWGSEGNFPALFSAWRQLTHSQGWHAWITIWSPPHSRSASAAHGDRVGQSTLPNLHPSYQRHSYNVSQPLFYNVNYY